jgi:hypothetical protein
MLPFQFMASFLMQKKKITNVFEFGFFLDILEIRLHKEFDLCRECCHFIWHFMTSFLMQKIKIKLYEMLVINAFEFVIYGHWCHVLPCVKCQHDSFILQSQIFLTDFKLMIYMPIKFLKNNLMSFNSQYFWKWTNANPMKFLDKPPLLPSCKVG